MSVQPSWEKVTREDYEALVAEIARMRAVHTEEQGRGADRLRAAIAKHEELERRVDAFRACAWDHLIHVNDDTGVTASGYGPTDIPDELLIDAIVDESADREALLERLNTTAGLYAKWLAKAADLDERVGVLEGALREALAWIDAARQPREAGQIIRAVLAGGEAARPGRGGVVIDAVRIAAARPFYWIGTLFVIVADALDPRPEGPNG